MNKGKLKVDPRGLLFEAYRIHGIKVPECKTIFLFSIESLIIDGMNRLELKLLPVTFEGLTIRTLSNLEDIQSDSGWRTLKEIQKSKPAICVSTGWLVKENRDVHILMSDYNYDEHNELSDGGNTTVIPTKNVIQKFLIKGL